MKWRIIIQLQFFQAFDYLQEIEDLRIQLDYIVDTSAILVYRQVENLQTALIPWCP